MPKMKSSSAAKKRFKKVGRGKIKIKRAKAYRRHLLTKKSPKKRQQLRKATYISKADVKKMLILLPN